MSPWPLIWIVLCFGAAMLFTPMEVPVKNESKLACYHCGTDCGTYPIVSEGKSFCCEGCKTVYEILEEGGLCQYYQLGEKAAVRGGEGAFEEEYAWLDTPSITQALITFSDGTRTHVRFNIPQIHCSSCIWLLEKLYKLHPSIVSSRVNFLRREVSIEYQQSEISLSEIAALLSRLGYPPDIHLDDLEQSETPPRKVSRIYYQLGIAGFCFGNIMLFSFPEYLSWGELDAGYGQFFGWLNLLLALPVFFYSARDYFLSAWTSIRQGGLNIDVPISIGILALFTRSLYEIVSQTGEGYMDSMVGLVFFLLIGKWFQQRTYERLSFDRSYRSYFPVAVIRQEGPEQKRVPINELNKGDIILIKQGEIIPADSVLLSGQAAIDYSFVTGESEPVEKMQGEWVYAGGRQTGPGILMQLSKPVSQSYLTQLWEQHQPAHIEGTQAIADRVARAFTPAILLIALAAGLFWLSEGIPKAINVFTAVLIVACPCGIALTSPFALGNAMRWMARARMYLKDAQVVESMAQVSHIVFDKTGTLSTKGEERPVFEGEPLSETSLQLLRSLTAQSNHPVSQALFQFAGPGPLFSVTSLHQVPGEGVYGTLAGRQVALGKKSFVAQWGPVPEEKDTPGRPTYFMIDGVYVGRFVLTSTFRPGWQEMVASLGRHFGLSVLSGDNEKDRKALAEVFPAGTPLKFHQSPFDKQAFVQALQASGEKVMMVGDGLNDAGALQESQVGVAVADNVNNFTPACDVIMDAALLPDLTQYLSFASNSLKVVRMGYGISLLYNIVGLAIAVQGYLSPVIAAILMPLSSLTVVLFATAATFWLGRRLPYREEDDLSQPRL